MAFSQLIILSSCQRSDSQFLDALNEESLFSRDYTDSINNKFYIATPDNEKMLIKVKSSVIRSESY